MLRLSRFNLQTLFVQNVADFRVGHVPERTESLEEVPNFGFGVKAVGLVLVLLDFLGDLSNFSPFEEVDEFAVGAGEEVGVALLDV